MLISVNNIFFTNKNETITKEKLVLNDKNYDEKLLTFSSTNKNESNLLHRRLDAYIYINYILLH